MQLSTMPLARACLIALGLLTGCGESALSLTFGDLAAGNWGGETAGMIVGDSMAHVHVGCTYGNFPLPIEIGRDGRFEAEGSYLIRAFPVAIGPTMPARLRGRHDGRQVSFTVTVTDTLEHQTAVLGPVTVVYGREPKLGPCPICSVMPQLP